IAIPTASEILPWFFRNWIWLRNPFSPLLNRLFPNPYYHPGMEQSLLADLRHYENLHHWWEIPCRHAVTGASVGGIVGPVFVLLPVALLALRNTFGRRLLLAALVFGLPAALNTETRTILPALPFLALSMGLALQQVPRVMFSIACIAAILSWP